MVPSVESRASCAFDENGPSCVMVKEKSIKSWTSKLPCYNKFIICDLFVVRFHSEVHVCQRKVQLDSDDEILYVGR